MKRRYLSVALTLGLAAGVAGCDDDFLTTIPQDQISDVVFWTTERDFTLAINAAYRDVNLGNDYAYFDGVSDIAYSGKDWTRNHAYAQGHQNASSGWANSMWGNYYRGIGRANEILNQLETTSAPLSATVRSQIEGQARFLRGYYYHQLLWMFGGVPIFTSVPTVAEAREVARNSRDEVINLVLADLTAAAAALPNSWPAAQYGRATRGAALAFQARAALYEASHNKYHENNAGRANDLFQVAADAAQEVINLGVYSLHPEFREIHTYAGQRSAEVIYDYQRISGVNGWAAWAWYAPHSMGGDNDLAPTRSLVDAFRMTDGLPISQSPMYDPAPPVVQDGQTVSLGMFANRDPRFYATVLFPGGTFNGRVYNSFPNSPTSDQLDHSNMLNTHTGFIQLKYVDPQDQADPGNSGINQILIRYADVLLMLAEAKIELNQIDATVQNALNQIRSRAGMPNITLGSQQQMIELVRNERMVELALEGLRLQDIRRWKIAELVMPGQVSGISFREGNQVVTARGLWQRGFSAARDYLWPIPVGERDLNPNLTQNPGY